MWVGILSLVVQVLVTGRIIKAIGTGPVGRAAAAGVRRADSSRWLCRPVAVAHRGGFQAVQRATNFGIANVARESLWTVVSREEKFKAKNIVDGAVFRGADASMR